MKKRGFTLVELMTIIAIVGLLSFFIMRVSGCDEKFEVVTILSDGSKVVRIDSCEYIKTQTAEYPYYMLTHKGNCSNPIHPYNTERK